MNWPLLRNLFILKKYHKWFVPLVNQMIYLFFDLNYIPEFVYLKYRRQYRQNKTVLGNGTQDY